MGKILNLASLKAKADAAGVGTTATSTTPNLCPQKSSIAGYVTNGSSTVSISGNWANNQLVPEDNVAIGKTITSTETVYRNVSIGNTINPGDISASGGRLRAQATVTYEYATKTNYSDGTSSIGEYQQESTTIYGGYVPSSGTAPDLGTTFKTRTSLGTSTPSGVVAGATRTGSTISIYQEANYIVYITPEPSDGHNYHVSYSNISGSGGSSNPTPYGKAIYKFNSGSTYTSESSTPFTNVQARFTRTYNNMVANPNNAFTFNSSGVITAAPNQEDDVRTAYISATLTVSIIYTGSYAGVYTPCTAGSLTQVIPCTQNASATGYDVYVTGPQGKVSPRLDFYSSDNTYLGTAHDKTFMSSVAEITHSEWRNSGTAAKVYISFYQDRIDFLEIRDMLTDTVWLRRTLISNNIYVSLTTPFATSSFNANNRGLMFIYSDISNPESGS